MARMIFISLPVSDLDRSIVFYKSLGFENNAQFTDESAACMVWSDAISIMLLTHEKWKTFTDRPIPASSSSEMMLAFSCESREAVDAMNSAAANNGGVGDINPIQDMGFMYGRDFLDPDGHALGAMWMDPAAMSGGQ